MATSETTSRTLEAEIRQLPGLGLPSRVGKRTLDLTGSLAGLFLTWWLVVLAALLARFDTGDTGLFGQDRVGRYGRRFRILKIRTMRAHYSATTVTTSNDQRVTKLGWLLRRTKIDELPQLWNILRGEMSFVGPRPDVPGFADELAGDDRLILTVRPGITGPATLKYRKEEEMLARERDPESYNRQIFADKVRINKNYIRNYRFRRDLYYIWMTISGR